MKLSLSTCAFDAHIKSGMSTHDVIQSVRRAGFSVVDYDLTEEDFRNPILSGRALKEAFREFGVTANQAHAPGFNFTLPENKDQLPTLRNNFLFCKEAGIPAIVVHPCAIPGNTREEFFEMNVNFFRSLLPFVEETGVGLLLENIGNPMDPYYLIEGKDLREMVDRVNHPLCTACWDIGHANHFSAKEHPQYDSILALGDKLTAIHFHDNAGNFDDPHEHHRVDMHTFPYVSCWTTLNYDAVLQGLKDVGYKGTFNMELCAAGQRYCMPPFIKDGKEQNKLTTPSIELSIKIYSTIYEIGKYMLETYGLFEE